MFKSKHLFLGALCLTAIILDKISLMYAILYTALDFVVVAWLLIKVIAVCFFVLFALCLTNIILAKISLMYAILYTALDFVVVA